METKRSTFPRFYFLSNEDLLEIIGQSKDPSPIQKHIKKVFEGIHYLDIAHGGGRNKTYEITGMISNKGMVEEESIKLHTAVQGQSKVEEWFGYLLQSMHETLKRLFHKCLTGIKIGKAEQSDKLDKYLSENPG